MSCVLMYCIELCVLYGRELSSRGPLPLVIYSEGVGLHVEYPILYYYNKPCGARRPAPCAARLHLMGWAISDGVAHVTSCGTRGYIPHS
jgi:hypothetical protein